MNLAQNSITESAQRPRWQVPKRVGDYEILGPLPCRRRSGQWLARLSDPNAQDHRFVLKIASIPRVGGDCRRAEAILKEANVLSRLVHPAIVRSREFFSRAGRLVLVLDCAGTESLQSLKESNITQGRRLEDSIVVYLAHTLFSALGHAHSYKEFGDSVAAIVHRDVHPANVLIGDAGDLFLTGFDFSRLPDLEENTAVGAAADYPSYLAPEQVPLGECSARADLYSAALLVWELFAGQSASPVRSDHRSFLQALAERRVPKLASLRPDLPSPVAAAIDTCLQPHPQDRILSGAQVADRILPILDKERAQGQLRELLQTLRLTRSASKPQEGRPASPASAPRTTSTSAGVNGSTPVPPQPIVSFRQPRVPRPGRQDSVPAFRSSSGSLTDGRIGGRTTIPDNTLEQLFAGSADPRESPLAEAAAGYVPLQHAARVALPDLDFPPEDDPTCVQCHVEWAADNDTPQPQGDSAQCGSDAATAAPSILPTAPTPAIASYPPTASVVDITEEGMSTSRWSGVKCAGVFVLGFLLPFSIFLVLRQAGVVAQPRGARVAQAALSDPRENLAAPLTPGPQTEPAETAAPRELTQADASAFPTLPAQRAGLLVGGRTLGLVYVNGHRLGPTGTPLEAPCGPVYLRIGVPVAPGGASDVAWITEGRTTLLECGKWTTLTQESLLKRPGFGVGRRRLSRD